MPSDDRDEYIEVNIDGLVGPTHHFGGLGVGNVASRQNQGQDSHPRSAALEGLRKMVRASSLGPPQAFLPPSRRPHRAWLSQLGFRGSLADQLKQAHDASPRLLSACQSSAFMWTANAACVAPSCDTRDSRLHILPSNLVSNLHRAIECPERTSLLRHMFQSVGTASVHDALPCQVDLRDEGAANHMRLCADHGAGGVHIWIHGPETWGSDRQPAADCVFRSARQSALASQATARVLQVPCERSFFLIQSQRAIDAGVFHNDVIATSHQHVVFHHEHAFEPGQRSGSLEAVWQAIDDSLLRCTGKSLLRVCVTEQELPLDDAVKTYLFNSQILDRRWPGSTSETQTWTLLAPSQCQAHPQARNVIEQWIQHPDIPITSVEYVTLQESMQGGGGPACLRLRATLSSRERQAINPTFWLTESSAKYLEQWIHRWYPERLPLEDLDRIDLAEHAWAAIDELHAWMGVSLRPG